MFPSLQLEILDRFTAVEQYLRKSPKDYGAASFMAQTARGLVFVQIYAVYEYTIKEATRIAIDKIAAHGHPYANLRVPLKALFLDPQLRALQSSGEKGVWERRLSLFEKAAAKNQIAPVDTMPHDGSHFRHTQIQMILRVLGIRKELTARRRNLAQIDEVVGHRNAISHGAETAAEIGRRYSRDEVFKRIRFMRRMCIRFIAIVSDYCSNPTEHCR
ncbi:MAG: MAE_28990/MAE_18760 family HEPN-like nuclease [Candidatus Angelobacter sp.]